MIYIGIDPGKQGAVACINPDGSLVVDHTPVIDKEYDIHKMGMLLIKSKALSTQVFVVIERAQAMPKQGVVSMFEFGKGYGIWLALLTTFAFPYQIIHSRVWTKEMLAGSPEIGKIRGIEVARRLFPTWNPALKKDLFCADAILLAEFARRLYKKET